MSEERAHPPAVRWPIPYAVPTPVDAPAGFTLARVDVPAALDEDTSRWLPALVSDDRLHSDEATLVEALSPARRATFVAGRLAMRFAMQAAAPAVPPESAGPILRTMRGGPALPPTVAGSVSHKRDAALALMMACEPYPQGADVAVGVDLEHRPTRQDLARPSIAHRILTAHELDALSALAHDPLAQRDRVILSFAIKEAVYKAIDPTVQRYVRFTEVALHFTNEGTVAVTLLLPELASGSLTVRAHYALDTRWIIATAIAQRG
jgi:4'-phosphopantetheinyl transferase EntD